MQRQATRKPAGFRTHVLVALGCCAFMELSRVIGDMRIAANILTGIGFLGAGAIVRDGAKPHGLTTAASIWAAAAAGTSAGYATGRAYEVALATTVLTLVTLSFSDAALDRVLPQDHEADLEVGFDAAHLTLDQIVALFDGFDLKIHRSDTLHLARDGETPYATWQLRVSTRHPHRLREAAVAVGRRDGIRSVSIQPRRQ